MEVILKKNVDKLGYTNEVVTVKPGYGRNFLIPQGYAVLATASAKKAHEEIMRQKSHKESKMLGEAQAIAAKLAEVTLSIATKAGENGKIFGSINTVQIAEALREAGAEVVGVAVIVERGAAPAIAEAGLPYFAAYSLSDLGLD